MLTFTTLSDIDYLRRGIALYESLQETTESNFKLYYLCLDGQIFDALSEINFENLIPIRIEEMDGVSDFQKLKENTKYVKGGFCTYCFALASFFTYYVYNKLDTQSIIYMDSDILFYQDIKDILDHVGERSAGIHLHRHVDVGHHVGGYNVGVVVFKGVIGKKILKWWRDCLIDPNNEWADQYGRVGDQAYLEAFAPLFGEENICVIDDKIGHGAPWNFPLYTYNVDGTIMWNEKKQKMYFCHFATFAEFPEKDAYTVDRTGGQNPQNQTLLKNPKIKKYYDDYYIRLKNIHIKYNIGST